MNLRQRVFANPETVSDLLTAGQARLLDARSLLNSQRYGGCVYLCGLGAEMLLKYAAFRANGLAITHPVAGLLGPARKLMQVHLPNINSESYHSLLFWLEYLMLVRRLKRTALSAEVQGELRHHVGRRLFQDWKIEFRYSSVAVGMRDALRVHQDASWVLKTLPRLWR